MTLQVTDDAVCELARRCSLRSLVLSGIHNLTDKCIFVLANSCPQLEEIFMNGCDQISPIAVRYLSVSNTSLDYSVQGDCSKIEIPPPLPLGK